jgi:hypothetical protein
MEPLKDIAAGRVQSATLATIVRYAQVQILTSIKDICKPPIERLVIQIRHSS